MATVERLPRKPGRPKGFTDVKSEIVNAAEVAFAVYGFDAASVRQIALAANISPAAVLHHFGSKRKLYAGVLRGISESLESHPVLTKEIAPGADSLRQVVAAIVDWIIENDLFARIILREIMDNEERVQSALQWPMRDGMQVIYGAVRQAMGAKPDDPISELLSLQVLGAAFLFYTGQPSHRSQSAVSVEGWEESFRSLLIENTAAAVAGTGIDIGR